MSIIAFVARNKFRYTRGTAWVSIFTTLISLMTLAKLYEASLTAMGLQPVQVYIIVTTAFFAIYWLIGYIDDIYGIWKAETSYASLTTSVNTLTDDMEEIKKKLDILIEK